MLTAEQIQEEILEKIICQYCSVVGDGSHFSATVVCESFEDKSILQRHRLLYQALGKKIGNEIHALSIEAFSCNEWKNIDKSKQNFK